MREPKLADGLPLIMVAPNGARRTKADHPNLPITVNEIVAAARSCHEAGAGALHAHVRDGGGAHALDARIYGELLARLEAEVPDLIVQITTEAAGRYGPEEQRQLVRDVKPAFVSAALRELVPENESIEARDFYRWMADEGIAVQHILYSAEDLGRFLSLADRGWFAAKTHLLLFVLGRYQKDQQSVPEDLQPFLDTLVQEGGGLKSDWAVCAFGRRETDCLVESLKHGGKARIGFENGLWNRDGSLARDNADRVRDLTEALFENGLLAVTKRC